MKRILRPVLLMTVISLALMAPAFAEEQPEPDLAADALQAPSDPPAIPHAVKPDQDGEACNVCHRDGVKKAPATSHPERLNCTSCHVQGEVKPARKPVRKGKTK